jgi:hypothetical protein
MRRVAVLTAVLAAGCGGSDADRAQLAKAERSIRQTLQALELEHGTAPRQIRASCSKDDERSFHCEYGYEDEIGGECRRYTATAHGTITPRQRYRLDIGEPVNGSLDPC